MVKMLTFGSLFSGIGGLDLGLNRAGLVCKWQVEKDEWCKRVLAKHWPDVPRFGDVRDVGKHNLEAVDVICGGFPCQPFSNAGKRRGKEDDRFLWPEMLRIVQELKPRWVFGENVTGFVNLYLDQAIIDLEGQGYEAWTIVLPACAFDAPHQRSRVFLLAYTDSDGQCRQETGDSALDQEWDNSPRQQRGQAKFYEAIAGGETLAHSNDNEPNGRVGDVQMGRFRVKEDAQANGVTRRIEWGIEPGVGRVAHGVPNRVDRLRGLGNAVVPVVAEFFGYLIREVDESS